MPLILTSLTFTTSPSSRNFGFTLIELLVTVAIVAALVCIAYPSYSHHLTAVRRAYAATALCDIAGRMEQFYVQNNSYSDATLSKLGIDETTASYRNYYHITINSGVDSYTLNAVPSGAQAQSDTLCSTLSLDEEGNKKISGSGAIASCWP